MTYFSYMPLLLLGATCALGADPLFYPSVGGVLVSTPSLTDLLKAIQGGNTLIAHFTLPASDDAGRNMDRVNQLMLQLVAQALRTRNVSVMCVSMEGQESLAEQHGLVADSVLVYKGGEPYVYKGHRSAEPLIAFIHKLHTPVVTIIQNKLDKKAFDHVLSSKVIGYFQAWPTNAEMLSFEGAAKAHYPSVPFFAVVTQEMAVSMRFAELGEVHVVHPFEKTPHVLTQNPATQSDISHFLQANARPSMQHVTMENLHGIWGSAGEARVVAFVRCRSPGGNALFKTLKNMAKFGLLRNTTDKTILLVNPEDFPTLVDHWQTTFTVDLTTPALGLINITDNVAMWADLTEFSTMNATDQLAYLSLWLEAVTAGRVRVDGQQAPPSVEHLDTVAKEAAAMANRAAQAAQAAATAAQAAAQVAQAANAAQSSATNQESSPSASKPQAGKEEL